MSKLTEGSWRVQDNPVVVRFVGGAVALVALFGWTPGSETVNWATDALSGAAYLYAMFSARSRVKPV